VLRKAELIRKADSENNPGGCSIYGADLHRSKTANGCPVLRRSRNHLPRGKGAQRQFMIDK